MQYGPAPSRYSNPNPEPIDEITDLIVDVTALAVARFVMSVTVGGRSEISVDLASMVIASLMEATAKGAEFGGYAVKELVANTAAHENQVATNERPETREARTSIAIAAEMSADAVAIYNDEDQRWFSRRPKFHNEVCKKAILLMDGMPIWASNQAAIQLLRDVTTFNREQTRQSDSLAANEELSNNNENDPFLDRLRRLEEDPLWNKIVETHGHKEYPDEFGI